MAPISSGFREGEPGAIPNHVGDERAIDHRVDSDAGLAPPEGVVREPITT